jgi:hypothetical protein
MATAARWIRMDRDDAAALRAGFVAFARAQSRHSRPAVLWGRAGDSECGFALVAPFKFAPGRRQRWPVWGLASLAAAWRRHGVRACLEADAISVAGERVAACESAAVGDCAMVACSFDWMENAFMETLRGRIESQHGWQFDHCWPSVAERRAMGGSLAGADAR